MATVGSAIIWKQVSLRSSAIRDRLRSLAIIWKPAFRWGDKIPWALSLVSVHITLDPYSRLCYNCALTSVYDVKNDSLKIWLIPRGSSKSERNPSEEVPA